MLSAALLFGLVRLCAVAAIIANAARTTKKRRHKSLKWQSSPGSLDAKISPQSKSLVGLSIKDVNAYAAKNTNDPTARDLRPQLVGAISTESGLANRITSQGQKIQWHKLAQPQDSNCNPKLALELDS